MLCFGKGMFWVCNSNHGTTTDTQTEQGQITRTLDKRPFVRPYCFIKCLVCPLFVLQNIKLSSIKVDTRYTTTQQVVKLIGSHTISKVTVKIGDLKRTKMVRTINLYYNNRTVQAIVELKNKYVLLSLLLLTPIHWTVKVKSLN